MTDPNPDEAFFKARGFGLTMGFGRRPAIIVVDIVNAFTDPDRPLGSDMSTQIAATNRLLAAGRARGLPLIFSTVTYDGADAQDAGIWILKQSGARSLIASGDGPDLDARLDFQPGDQLLKKKYASCFFGTDLVSRLVAAGVDTLIVTGGTTSGCVRATTVDSVQYGFRPIVVADAVGDRSAASHEQSLFDIRQKYGDVVSTDEVVAYLEALEVAS